MKNGIETILVLVIVLILSMYLFGAAAKALEAGQERFQEILTFPLEEIQD